MSSLVCCESGDWVDRQPTPRANELAMRAALRGDGLRRRSRDLLTVCRRYCACMLDVGRVEVVVVGAGLAGLVTTLELLERADGRIMLVDRCAPHEVGGLAREAFGGMFMVDTREQRFSR